MSCTPISNCLACGGHELENYLDLGSQPLANAFHSADSALPRFPLSVNLCTQCYHSQLTVAVDPGMLFKHYLYVSGTSGTMKEYFLDFVNRVEGTFSGRSLRVLDIASNDGTLLEIFKRRGHTVQGVDPAVNLGGISSQKGIPTIVDFWSESLAVKMANRFDVVIAMNVLAHVPNPAGFLAGCKRVLARDGHLYIQTSQAEMLGRSEFDTIYHEHLSFFTVESFRKLAGLADFSIERGEKVPVHGGSYLWTLRHSPGETDASVLALLAAERQAGYYSKTRYSEFGGRIQAIKQRFLAKIQEYREAGFRIVGYGAAAKANTFLNFFNLQLDWIIDDNPMKVGLFTPGMNIEVVSCDRLARSEGNLLVVVLGWNFLEEILMRIRRVRKDQGGVAITCFPEIREYAL